jgi:hypothetical protein
MIDSSGSDSEMQRFESSRPLTHTESGRTRPWVVEANAQYGAPAPAYAPCHGYPPESGRVVPIAKNASASAKTMSD